ncbi:DUF202 domain-containing protein [Liquorilactobacillus satsumensis]|uniref:DUF202 domain-containing protein n=1 Tax=Liquorilactobacillus satsumensis TaxID=259059 RepID=UPI00345C8AD2
MTAERKISFQEISAAYRKEVQYQRKMMFNLQLWLTLFFLIAGSSVVVIYYAKALSLGLVIAAYVALVISICLILLLGYILYKGRQNVERLIANFRDNLHEAGLSTKDYDVK